jgi:6-pyruvoyltetrahydropterin/6-carboxytetrahydropterin synthase
MKAAQGAAAENQAIRAPHLRVVPFSPKGGKPRKPAPVYPVRLGGRTRIADQANAVSFIPPVQSIKEPLSRGERIRESMYEVTVEAGFSSGHYLRNYRGKCENPHGHNYKVRVTLSGRELDEAGLLLDFKLLKQVMRPVIDRIDHQMLNDLSPFTELNPSAENLARYFFDETNQQLAKMTAGRVKVKDCTIYETDTTTATYYE